MKRICCIISLFVLCLTFNQAHAQRCLPGMKGLQVTGGMADGVHWNSKSDFAYYKNNDREIKHLGCKRFGVQFLVKGIYAHNGLFYFHTQTRNSSNVPFDTDFIRFKIVDKKVAKRTAIQETVIDPVRSYNEILVIGGKSTVRTVYTVPQFTIPDDKVLVIELVEKNGGRHQTIRVENSDIVAAKVINELKIK